MMINFNWYSFAELTVNQLYDVLALRASVFIVEQNIIYQDLDGKDMSALHLLGTLDNKLVAYLRLFPPTETQKHVVFGRVLTASSARTSGHGKKLMQEMLSYCEEKFPGISIKCSAQDYLREFYKSFGFKITSDVYQDEGVAHIDMQKDY